MNISSLTKLQKCNHSFCDHCIHAWFHIHKHNTCPMCRCVVPKTTNALTRNSFDKTRKRTYFSDEPELHALSILIGA